MTSARTVWRVLAIGFLATVAGFWAFFAYLDGSGNFHEVVAGEVYRSNQVTPEALATYTADHGIRSVLNLRGAQPGTDWYDAEIAASETLGLAHADFPMIGSVQLSDTDARRLIALMRTLPKPLLVHCRYGADRTGLAMALYLGAIRGAGKSEAEGQLSIRYGHVSLPYLSSAYAMDESWDRLAKVLGLAGG
jgi:protein tyrosine/serine phosphatase